MGEGHRDLVTVLGCAAMMRSRVAPVSDEDLLCGLAMLANRPAGGVSWGDVVGPREGNKALGERGGSISSRSASVMELLRGPWNQNLAPPTLPMRA